ncbi:MAG TPA: tetratricopeptide repeat protein [Anaerolineales bacterium]|nr:tetratricopeptide repeat protein [Anaerolineales bacterium]
MDRNLSGERPHFRPEKRSINPYRVIILLALIMGGIWILMSIDRGDVQPLFQPTPTATRTVNSYIMEGEAQFYAGSLGGAIEAYQLAVSVEPNNAHAWAELARIQTYSSSLLSTDEERYDRLTQALASIDQATAIEPDNAELQAVRSFVLDWYASNLLVPPDESQTALNDAEAAAIRALQLDNENALALAFLAEILVDQQKWSQAEETIKQAVAIDSELMDVQRVYGYVLESLGQYRLAIEKYQEAVNLNPNLTFLYIFIGRNFRSLEVHNRALEEFERAAQINEQLGVQDPVPFVEIAKTYSRDGEFFVAALNAEKAIRINPYNANTYGQLGIIYTKARNFEGAQPVLKCAVQGCSPEENQVAQELLGEGVAVNGLPLTSGTVAFYYAQYGSVLAALSRPTQNFCPEALEVLSEVRASYPEDPTLNQIIEENIAICDLVTQRSAPQASPAP